MQILRELPPNYEEIAKTLSPTDRTVFTYGNTLYCPNLGPEEEIPDHLLAHEEVHAQQQTDPVAWWNQYLIDPEFRYEQELQAYGAQYAFVRSKYPPRVYENLLASIAIDLCSPLYGLELEQAVAESRIRNKAKSFAEKNMVS